MALLDRQRVASLMFRAEPNPVRAIPDMAEKAPTAAEPDDARQSQAPSGAREADPPRHPTAVIYRSPAQLDQPVRTRSQPDTSRLNGLPWSGSPIRLRLFIDSQGMVVDIQVLQSAEDPEVLARVRQMFLDTGFTPGVEHGQPVPSYKDIEINVGATS